MFFVAEFLRPFFPSPRPIHVGGRGRTPKSGAERGLCGAQGSWKAREADPRGRDAKARAVYEIVWPFPGGPRFVAAIEKRVLEVFVRFPYMARTKPGPPIATTVFRKQL